ncbi:biotin--protein ligase [Bordetella sp. H567]|uniref:biotin--[acetyl-CoA-carboxylase] ligase n=1 Tax=Bordetella sp. H567 TaxID=1697043 RepID=UPI00081C5745|nr:biotin--[acetyl-CoA-carboxylase] ligase [Bordetella sp. H567]AOB33087.1 biotin--protein ligase [Bordetella sp. H567]
MPDLPELPTPDHLAAALRARLMDGLSAPFGRVDWVAQTGSTNADLLARARARASATLGAVSAASEGAGSPKPWLLGAHLQQTGRGRAGRAWQNRPGAALMFSCAFDTMLPPASLPVLSPLAGLVACEALRGIAGTAGERLCVKWPNDVQWGDAKLAGVLVETTRNLADRTASHTVVIGMGMNLRDGDALSHALERQVADWSMTNCGAALSDIVCAVALAWRDALADVERDGFAGFVGRFRRLDALEGRDIQVLDKGSVLHHGLGCGVDAQGRLRIRTWEGELPVSVGEISVRPA